MPNPSASSAKIILIISGSILTFTLCLACRLLEWPAWQNPEFSYDNEMLLATHDAYHWVAGACGFGRAIDHPMAVMLRSMAQITTIPPAVIAFWFPAFLASLVGVILFFWCGILGSWPIGIAAGLIACISPGFLGRTLLGYYDTDLITLFFPLLISILPALWCIRFLIEPSHIVRMVFKKETSSIVQTSQGADSLPWIIGLAVSGLLAWWTREWHSVFPYLLRYNVLLLFFMICIFSRNRATMLRAALAYVFPSLLGFWGLFILLVMLPQNAFMRRLYPVFWLAAFCLLAQGELFNTFVNQINAYLKHATDAHSTGKMELVYPSVAQSIIEVQDLSFAALFPYFHPWLEAALLGFAGYLVLIFRKPSSLFLLPLAALGLLSSKLGGRMVMFGAPVVALGITFSCFWIMNFILRKYISRPIIGLLSSGVLIAVLVVPFLDMIPAMSQGPILNRRHAAALAQAKAITPPDAILWLWWDWGYAAHYFARRNTIADGAMHGGPSLYLPAAVFASEDARFARQIIKRASALDNIPGNFFKDISSVQAQELIETLRNPATALVEGSGKQYLVVSFEMLKLGFWISNFGNWNFVTGQGEGGALSIVPEAVAYRFNAGEVRLAGSESIIFPTSINIFEESGVKVKNYIAEWFQAHPAATRTQQKAWLASRRNINFLFNKVTDEKLAVDQGIYNSLMVQLLLCEASDPRFSPYFRLVYDNVFTRIYEVLP